MLLTFKSLVKAFLCGTASKDEQTTLYHLDRVGNEKEMKFFDMGVLAFYTFCGRSERGFLALHSYS